MSISLLAPPDVHDPMEHRTTPHVQVNWATVAVCAVVITYIDGYWVTSLRSTVGAIEGSQRPFTRWLRDSTLMLPLVLVAVLAALTLTRRWLGRSRHEIAQVGTAALLIIVISSAVSIAGVATTSVYDYNIQAANLGQIHSSHVTSVAVDPGVSKPSTEATSGALDAAKHATSRWRTFEPLAMPAW